jgi:V/A-type H+/Na+-transporting ATPase subunit I
MISDELFQKIIQLEKQSEELIQNAKEQVQMIDLNCKQAIDKIKQEAEEELQRFIHQKQQEVDREQKSLQNHYHKMYEDIAQKILKQRDTHIDDHHKSIQKRNDPKLNMAIETLLKLQFVVNHSDLHKFRNALFHQGIIHLRNISSKLNPLKTDSLEEQALRSKLNKINYLLELTERYSPKKSSFIDNFIPNKPIIEAELLQKTDHESYLDLRYQQIKSQEELISNQQERIALIESQLKELKPYQNYLFRFEELTRGRHLTVIFIEARNYHREDLLKLYPSLFKLALIEDAPGGEKENSFVLVAPLSSYEEINKLLKRSDLQAFSTIHLKGSPAELIQALESEKERIELQIQEAKSSLSSLSSELGRLLLFKDLNESQLAKIRGNHFFTSSRHVSVIEGYIPAKDFPKLEVWLQNHFPEIYFAQHPADETAPIKFNNKVFFAPFEFLLRMFGLPRYGMIDPTPVVSLLFLVLFGIAFGDVIYGLTLFALCQLISKKYSHDEGTVRFMRMFKYAGISSAFFGMLTTSWAGDLISSYTPKSSLIHRIHSSLGLINTSEHVMTLMVAIIYLGVFAQMTGVAMSMLQSLKEKKWIQAIFDQLSWLFFMPSITLIVGQFLVPGYYPETLVFWAGRVVYLAVAMIFIGGFIKTRNPLAGIFSGTLNFYGILSTYGVSALMADVLSYLRLLALAVATSSMAMSFNLVSFLFKDIPVIGPILVVVVLLFSNMLNLLLSVLGSFVHPVRLLFYEVFSRFYQDGGIEFNAYGLRFRHVFVKQREA